MSQRIHTRNLTGAYKYHANIPLPDFAQSAAVLDQKRLQNQLNECKVIAKVLYGLTTAWQNHPVVRMWRGYEPA